MRKHTEEHPRSTTMFDNDLIALLWRTNGLLTSPWTRRFSAARLWPVADFANLACKALYWGGGGGGEEFNNKLTRQHETSEFPPPPHTYPCPLNPQSNAHKKCRDFFLRKTNKQTNKQRKPYQSIFIQMSCYTVTLS